MTLKNCFQMCSDLPDIADVSPQSTTRGHSCLITSISQSKSAFMTHSIHRFFAIWTLVPWLHISSRLVRNFWDRHVFIAILASIICYTKLRNKIASYRKCILLFGLYSSIMYFIDMHILWDMFLYYMERILYNYIHVTYIYIYMTYIYWHSQWWSLKDTIT